MPKPKKSRSAPERWGDNEQYGATEEKGVFTAGETGAPDQDPEPGSDNPQGVQSGLGPLSQRGQGNRQNDELEELEAEPEEPEQGL